MPERESSAHYKKISIREHEYYLRLKEAERNDVTKFHWTEKAKSKIVIVFPFALLGLFIYLYNYLSPNNLRNFLLASNIAFLIALIFSYLSFREGVEVQRDDVKTQARRDLLKIICITIFVAYAGGSYAQASAIKIVLNHSEHEVILVTEEKTIATSKNYRYIGKSKDYIFFYNISKKQADVFKLDKVKYLSITDGIEYK